MGNIDVSRLDWVDQVKGFTIFLVVYGHNFPFCEKFIYNFHMPLFIIIAGFFHHPISSKINLHKRFKTIIIPYFFWGFTLYAIWYFFGRHYGESVAFNLSPIKNLVGVFYAQGDRSFMDWGIPMWFLPAIFMTYLIHFLINKLTSSLLKNAVLFLIPIVGFLYTRNFDINLPWSINIAFVAFFFYCFGSYFFKKISDLNTKYSIIIMILCFILNLTFYDKNIKIDMYRAIYGNEFYFLLNGLTGSIFFLLFFKTVPYFKLLSFIGKFSLLILVLQLVSLSFIKLMLLKVFNQSDFSFSELEKFLFAIIQIILLVPVFLIINNFFPILNGGYKKI